MMNPYKINEPAAISFSGGRTSAYMLYRILQAYDGVLPDYLKVIFANTGKEMPQTLNFVRDCSERWGVDIVWVELAHIWREDRGEKRAIYHRTYKTTDYEHAAREGEPFDALLKGIDPIPNVAARTCTVNLKQRAMVWYLKSIGYESPWVQFVGLRGDEPRRAAKLHGVISEGHEVYCPLFIDGITKEHVGDFWRKSNFDLALPNNNGVTDWGNCDLCFLKGQSKRAAIIRERPDLASWWANWEEIKRQRFRPDQASYEQMKVIASDQGNLFDFGDDNTIPCFCTD
jgi:3'-phosphoadenosine 5'-phosphosulfate sulfotransferase (PAPS reductase)/FAD synthetase